MRFAWLWGNYAEPEHGLDPAEGRRITHIARDRYVPRWKIALATVVTLIMLEAGVRLAWTTMRSRLGADAVWSRLAAYAFVACAVWVGSAWVFARLYRRAVRRAMRELGRDVCLECGYYAGREVVAPKENAAE